MQSSFILSTHFAFRFESIWDFETRKSKLFFQQNTWRDFALQIEEYFGFAEYWESATLLNVYPLLIRKKTCLINKIILF